MTEEEARQIIKNEQRCHDDMEILNSDNYRRWTKAMKVLLELNGLEGEPLSEAEILERKLEKARRWLQKYDNASKMTFRGVPISEFTHEELMRLANHLAEKHFPSPPPPPPNETTVKGPSIFGKD